MRDLLDRALAWRPPADQKPKKADPTTKYYPVLNPFTAETINPNDILTPEEVAARLKVPESWVYEKTRARCRNPMPCLRLGRYIRFDWNAVITWLTAASTQEQNAARTSLPSKRKLVR